MMFEMRLRQVVECQDVNQALYSCCNEIHLSLKSQVDILFFYQQLYKDHCPIIHCKRIILCFHLVQSDNSVIYITRLSSRQPIISCSIYNSSLTLALPPLRSGMAIIFTIMLVQPVKC